MIFSPSFFDISKPVSWCFVFSKEAIIPAIYHEECCLLHRSSCSLTGITRWFGSLIYCKMTIRTEVRGQADTKHWWRCICSAVKIPLINIGATIGFLLARRWSFNTPKEYWLLMLLVCLGVDWEHLSLLCLQFLCLILVWALFNRSTTKAFSFFEALFVVMLHCKALHFLGLFFLPLASLSEFCFVSFFWGKK